jgi:hypothetical protein
MRAEGDEHLSDDRFARGDPASKSDFQHKQGSRTVVSGQWSVETIRIESFEKLPDFSSACAQCRRHNR